MFIVEIWDEESFAERYDPGSIHGSTEVCIDNTEDLTALINILLRAKKSIHHIAIIDEVSNAR